MRGANDSQVDFDGPVDFEKNDMMDWLDDIALMEFLCGLPSM